MKAYYRALVGDLKESITILLNDYIKEKAVTIHYTKHHEKIAQLRKQLYELQMSKIAQKRNFTLASEGIKEAWEELEITKAEVLRSTETGKLIEEKAQLHKTIATLSEEIEKLSITNETLLKNLQKRSFFDQYHQTIKENAQLRAENEAILAFQKPSQVQFDTFNTRPTTSFSLRPNKYSNFLENAPKTARIRVETASLGREEGSQCSFNSTMKVSAFKVPSKESFKRKFSKPQHPTHSKKLSIGSKTSLEVQKISHEEVYRPSEGSDTSMPKRLVSKKGSVPLNLMQGSSRKASGLRSSQETVKLHSNESSLKKGSTTIDSLADILSQEAKSVPKKGKTKRKVRKAKQRVVDYNCVKPKAQNPHCLINLNSLEESARSIYSLRPPKRASSKTS